MKRVRLAQTTFWEFDVPDDCDVSTPENVLEDVVIWQTRGELDAFVEYGILAPELLDRECVDSWCADVEVVGSVETEED